MVDHRVLDGKVAARSENRLIVRGGIFARVDHRPGLHRGLGLVDIPIRLLLAAEGDGVNGIQLPEIVHRSGRDQINVRKGPGQDGHIRGDAVRHGRVPGDDEECLIVADREARIVLARVGNRKLRGVLKRERPVKRQVVPRNRACRLALRRFRRGGLLLRRGAGREGQQQRGEERYKELLHSAAVSVAESKFSVYSISCGVLIAVVSPMTVSSVSKAATGISNVEPGSVVRTS